MEIAFKRLNDAAIEPKRATNQAAAYDLYCCGGAEIWPHETVMLDTGIAIALPAGYFGGLYARSGLACKSDLGLANGVGVIDADYRGEIKVALHNYGTQVRTVAAGSRVAQLIVQPYAEAALVEVDELDDTERGGGGFGHTGLE